MKTKTIFLITLFLTFLSSCNKGNINQEIIEYQGDYPIPENIEYEENGIKHEIEAIPGQIVISTDVDYNTVIKAVNAYGGTVIEQYPQFGLFTIEVASGNERVFLTAMEDLNISAELNIVEYPKERFDYFVFDDYANVNGIQHGRKVSNILSECQNNSTIKEINNYIKVFIPLNITNVLLWNNLLSQDMILVNWSHGYGSQSADWQNMSETEKNSFKIGWKKSVARKLDQIIRLKKKNPNIDIVFAQAAGNERCPELAQMINDIKSNPKYRTILEENMIFVSDYSDYANTSNIHDDFCYIKDHPYYEQNGGTTSFATPQALCIINQVINGTIGEDGNNITAVQALAAVKAAVRQNNKGELDIDEALGIARAMYSSGYFVGTPFDKVRMIFNGTETIHISSSYLIRKDDYDFHSGTFIYHNETITEESTDNVPINITVEFDGKQYYSYVGKYVSFYHNDYLDSSEDSWIELDYNSSEAIIFAKDSVIYISPSYLGYSHPIILDRYKNGTTYFVSASESNSRIFPTMEIFPCAYNYTYPYWTPPILDFNQTDYVFCSGDYTLNSYFENNNTFCFKQNINSTESRTDPGWILPNHLTNTECVVKYYINPNTHTCRREIQEIIYNATTDDYEHTSARGIISRTKNVIHSVNGIWEKME